MKTQPYYIYLLRCEDNTLYTGITTDIERRLKEHHERGEKCAKYTLRHPVKKLEAAWQTQDRSLASKLEYQLKHLTKRQKEQVIARKGALVHILQGKIQPEYYQRIK